MGLVTLRRKRRARGKERKRQRRLFKRTGDRGHAKAAAKHGRAMRYLTGRIEAVLRQIRQGQVDWNGCEPLPLSRRKARIAAAWVLANVDGLYISSTVRYDSTTYHGPSQRRAIDFGSDDPNEGPEREAQHKLLAQFGAGYFLELFGPDNEGWVKNGSTYTATEGEFLETLHDNHTHMAA